MAEITLTIGGHRYMLACGEGEEAALQRLAAEVDARIAQQRAQVGHADQSRELLMVALLLADELGEQRQQASQRVAAPADNGDLVAAIDARTQRLTSLAQRLGSLSRPAT